MGNIKTNLQDLFNDTLSSFIRGLSEIYNDYEHRKINTPELHEEQRRYRETDPLVIDFIKTHENEINNYITPSRIYRVSRKYPPGFGSYSTIRYDLAREYMEKKGLI